MGRAILIPSVAVAVSLLGAVGVMFLLGFSLDNFSLMALTVSTGFVVDDAIVVLENVTRHVEAGMSRLEAALLGAKEVAFMVLSISLSLVAVFLPILLMGGLVGRLFNEFAMTLSAAILVSLVVSLTTTPMMCAFLIDPPKPGARRGWLSRVADGGFAWMLRLYQRALDWVLGEGPLMIFVLVATIGLFVFLVGVVPKGFSRNRTPADRRRAAVRSVQFVRRHRWAAGAVREDRRRRPVGGHRGRVRRTTTPAAASCSSASSRRTASTAGPPPWCSACGPSWPGWPGPASS